MYQQPIPMHPAGTTTNGLYAAPQAVPVVPIQGQAGPVVDPVSGVVVGGSPNIVPGTTGTMPMVGNATVMPTTTTTAAPLVQQQYMTTLGTGLGYDRPVITGVVPVAGGYSATTMGGYGGGYGGYGYGGIQQANPSVVVVDNGRRRHRSHSHGRHHHRHHSHSHGRHGFRAGLRQMADDIRMGNSGYGHGGYGYGYNQYGGVAPISRHGHHGGLRRTRSYDSFY
ncbi:hypothetical protein PM082_007632 [Marasmius tenuissimus]|nr:hypothetical protein PM082_007632 [Marasmius tenuissimus]